MNIGNHGYSSWIHNRASQTGYGNGYRAAKTGTGKTFSAGNQVGDTGVMNGAEAKDGEKKAEEMTCREQILAHMEEMAKKVREGKVEPTFQIGAQTFTIKEWEKLLADFDDAEEGLQEQIKELIAEVEKQAGKESLRRQIEGGATDPNVVTNVSVPEAAQPRTEAGGSVANPSPADSGRAAVPRTASEAVAGNTAVPAAAGTSGTKKVKDDNVTDVQVTDPEELASLLTDEVTKCTYPTDDPRHKHWFITCYGQDGIRCREAYFENGKWVNKDCWSLSYTEKGQYEKVMAFLQRFPQDANLRFAAHENFWKDFLAGEIDEDDFVHFFETSTDKDGVPDYTYEKDGSIYIDRDKAKYAKYMNGFGAQFYTAEEMELIQRAVINENRKGLQKISDYDGQMTIPDSVKTGDGKDGEDDLETQIITKPDGSVVLQIETNFGVMEVEVTEAQKFGLQYNARLGTDVEQMRSANPFARGAGAAAYEATEL